MTNWPSNTDYVNALQNPATAFVDPVLQASSVPPKGCRYGIPKPRTGNFAAVFRLAVDGQDRAMRVYRSPVHASWSSDHYLRLTRLFHTQSRPTCLIHFHYEHEGIRIKDNNYPFLLMDWLEGATLDNWVKMKVEANDTAALTSMASKWSDTVLEMKREQLTHGDLQHGNIMIVNDTIRLVDYDGLWLPTLGSREAPEAGLPAYQHPQRGGNRPQSVHLDDFSAWLILLNLQALAAEPNLWDEYREQRNHDNLLVVETDLRDPGTSRLWPRLERSPDPQVRHLAEQIRADLDRPFEQTTPFRLAPPTPPPPPTSVPDQRDSAADLRRAWQGGCRHWGTLIELAHSIPRQDVPPDLAPVLTQIDLRVAAVTKLREELDRIPRDPQSVLQAYKEHLIADRPECGPLVEQVERIRKQVLAQQQQKKQDEQRLQSEATNRLNAAMQAVPPSDREIVQAYQTYLAAGCLQPSSDTVRKYEQSLKRVLCLEILDQPPVNTSLDELDRWWVESWDEKLLADCPDAEPYRSHYKEANRRYTGWSRVSQALANNDFATLVEALEWPWLPAYPPASARWSEIQTGGLRGQRIERLRVALSRDHRHQILGELQADLTLLDNSSLFRDRRHRERTLNLVREAWKTVTVNAETLTLEQAPMSGCLRLTWQWDWPNYGLPRSVHVAVNPDHGREHPPQGRCCCYAPNESVFENGVFLFPLPEAASIRVMIWPVLVLGEEQVVGQCCEITLDLNLMEKARTNQTLTAGPIVRFLERCFALTD